MLRTITLKELKLKGSIEDLQDPLELTPPKDVPFIIGAGMQK